MTSALVLGGGGVAGIAWEAGLVSGLREAGVDLTTAGRVVGTSAGSVVGALIATGADLASVLSNQVETRSPGSGTGAGGLDVGAAMAAFEILGDPELDPKEARRRVGSMALGVTGDGHRLRTVGKPFAGVGWPERDFQVTAVNAGSGEFVVWTKDSGVPLELAVMSSCAVPLVFPPVEIDGHPYMDGGTRSVTNADLAQGAERLVVLEPMGHLTPRAVLEDELRKVNPARSVVVIPDQASIAVFGVNILDPALWGPAYKAGETQAAAVAERVADVWN